MRNWGILGTACLLLVACGETVEVEREPVVRPAKLITVSDTERERQIRLPAIVGAADTSILTFQVGGLLQELQITEGLEVERGQVLARLDQRDYRNNVASAQATFDNALAEFQRAERLIAENAIARSVFEQRRSQRDVAQASLDSARKQLDDTTIRAPFSGLVADIHVESFENISPTQPVLTLQSAGDAEAVVQVPASLVINIEQLEPIDQFLELDAAPGVRLQATFVEAASVADATTQTFEARFAFTPPPELVILPGMTGILSGRFRSSVDATFETGGVPVPISAILSEAGVTYVWIVDTETMTVARRDVNVAPGIDESVWIREGLDPGEVIVGAGGAYLTQGAEIRAYEN